MIVDEQLAKLDRYIISKREVLEKGFTLTVQVTDGYILILNEVDEETKEQRTKTFFSDFDDKLNVSFKKILKSDLKEVKTNEE